MGTKLTTEEQLVDVYGRRYVRVLKRQSLEDGINAARTMFPICYFDQDRCVDGLHALGHYRYEVLDEKGNLSKVPVHDENSNGADAFRYVAMGRKAPKMSTEERRAKLARESREAVLSGADYAHGGRPTRGSQFNWMNR